MIDIHCHILPATDDGPGTWEAAVEMSRIAAEDGIRHIIATPHASDEYSYDRDRHLADLASLRETASPGLEFSLGCDFHLSPGNIADALLHRDRYVIGRTSYLLIELPSASFPRDMIDLLRRLQDAALRPILTHPERNLALQKCPENVLDWVSTGCIVQVTANSLSGRWGERALQTAQFLLQNDAVHVIATDAHNTTSRPPILSEARKAVSAIAGHDVADALVEFNPAAIIANRELPYCPKRNVKK